MRNELTREHPTTRNVTPTSAPSPNLLQTGQLHRGIATYVNVMTQHHPGKYLSEPDHENFLRRRSRRLNACAVFRKSELDCTPLDGRRSGQPELPEQHTNDCEHVQKDETPQGRPQTCLC